MPMIEIGVGLRELGHDVTLLTGSGFTDLARRAGLPVIALPEDVQIDPPSKAPAVLRRLPVQLRRFWLGRAELDTVFARPLVAEDRDGSIVGYATYQMNFYQGHQINEDYAYLVEYGAKPAPQEGAGLAFCG